MSDAHVMGRTAVVIMAKEPAAGRTKTRLCPPLSPLEAAELSEALLLDTIDLVSRLTGVWLGVAVTPASAVAAFRVRVPHDALVLAAEGEDIGACLSQITGQLLAEGASRVMAVNSDGPTLPPAYLEQARALLDHHDVVLGPSEDGGYYLVGLRHPAPGIFHGIAWSTARVMAQTLERAATLGLSVALLPPWYDVDTGADLERLRADLRILPLPTLPSTRRFFDARRADSKAARDAGQMPAADPLNLPQKEVSR